MKYYGGYATGVGPKSSALLAHTYNFNLVFFHFRISNFFYPSPIIAKNIENNMQIEWKLFQAPKTFKLFAHTQQKKVEEKSGKKPCRFFRTDANRMWSLYHFNRNRNGEADLPKPIWHGNHLHTVNTVNIRYEWHGMAETALQRLRTYWHCAPYRALKSVLFEFFSLENGNKRKYKMQIID